MDLLSVLGLYVLIAEANCYLQCIFDIRVNRQAVTMVITV